MSDTRNVIDLYKYWKIDAIRSALDKKRHSFGILCSNLHSDYNVSTCIRNGNAFLSKEIYIYGRRRYDRRGTVGTHHYENLIYLPTEEELDKISGYIWVGIDNIDNAIPMEEYDWPKNTLMCLGQETSGLPPEIIKRCKDIVYISQFSNVDCCYLFI